MRDTAVASGARQAVVTCGQQARQGAASLAAAPDAAIDDALRRMASLLGRRAAPVLAANEADMMVTFSDLGLRQYVVTPPDRRGGQITR